MTTVTLTSTESRHCKAILLAADAGQWLRPDRLIDGHRAVGIPSQTKRGLFHWTDGRTCSCYDFRNRQQPCKHVIAHRLDAIARPIPQPASDVVDGLQEMVAERHPVLDLVREEDGSMRWEAHHHENGNVTYLPRHQVAANAARYDEIFKPEED